MNDDCLFCRMVSGEIPVPKLYEDDNFIVIKDKFPKAEVHLLVVPRQHIPSLVELGDEHRGLIADSMLLLPRLAREQGLKGFRTVINTGREGGQEIFHLHIHLLGGKMGGM